jgi:hypothetical protein
MGAWGLLFNENDDAADWLAEFSDEPNWNLVDHALAAIPNDTKEYVEAPECSQALAAAEVVAAAIGKPSTRLDDGISAWATDNTTGGEARADIARIALARIRDNSELQELWEESDEYADWQASVNETVSRLV